MDLVDRLIRLFETQVMGDKEREATYTLFSSEGGLISDPTWKEYVLQTYLARPSGTAPQLQRLYCQMQRGDVRIVDMLSLDSLYT